MKNKKIVTYSLLAHINNTGTLSKGLLEVFIPLAKRALSILNNEGVYSGKSITEIQFKINELYSIDIPVPVLNLILDKISYEVNKENNKKFTLYSDGAFAIKNYVFTEFDSLIKKKEVEIAEIEELFKHFCEISEIPRIDYSSIFTFLEKNKLLISKYINIDDNNSNDKDYSIEAQFIEFFKKIPPIYEKLKDLYLGTIISTYIEYSSPKTRTNIELLLDTNFLISLIDLNTPESTHSCRKLIEIARHHGYKLTVLIDTIEETERLLYRRSESFNEYYLTKKINPEDIYNACDRRKLSKTDLEMIADTLQETLSKDYGIYILPYTEKYKNIAKFSKEYTSLKKYRNNDAAALHDATALYYVRDKRDNKRYKSFERVPCWFVNNAVTYVFNNSNGDESLKKNNYQPEIIKVDILLNILWLSNPSLNNNNEGREMSETGLSCLVSSTLIESMPKNAILKELDDNINKYASEALSAEQVVRVATRIANKQITNLQGLNNLANEDKEKFVKTLQKEADKQQEIENKRIEQIESVLSELSRESEKARKKNDSFKSLEEENISLKKQLREIQEREQVNVRKEREVNREQFIKNDLTKWRRKSWIEFSISIFFFITTGLYLFSQANWSFNKLSENIQILQSNFMISCLLSLSSLIFSGIVVKTLFNKYRNHSNINAYKTAIKLPDELREEF